MKQLNILFFVVYFLLPNVLLQAQPSLAAPDAHQQQEMQLQRALQLIEASHYAQALVFLDSVLQYADSAMQPHFYFYRGMCYSELQRYEPALEDFAQTIALDSSFLDAYFERAYIEFDLKSYKAAIQDYTHVINLYSIQNNLNTPNNAKVGESVNFYNSLPLYYYLRGEAYIYAQQRSEGCLDIQKALDLGWEDGLGLQKLFCK